VRERERKEVREEVGNQLHVFCVHGFLVQNVKM
jgi:hypothetical protein